MRLIMANSEDLECSSCNKTFSNQSNLYRHVKTVHKTSKIREELLPVKCKEPGCNYGCRVMEKLVEHLSDHHNMNLEYSLFVFKDKKEYKDWKVRVEKHTHSLYIQVSGSKKSKEGKRTHYYCNRTGNFKPKGTGQRKIKESIKIGGHCTSHMVVTECSDQIEVKFCKTHYGHTCGIQHVQLGKKEIKDITLQVHQGATLTAILDKVSQVVSDGFQQRKDITNNLLRNVQSAVFFNQQNQNSDSLAALISWIEHVKNMGDYNPVKHFKPIGVKDQVLELDEEYFFLTIVTKFQEKMLKKFKSNLICVDQTVGAENGNFGLLSVIATDDEGHAIPVSFLISNKQDKYVFKAYFSVLKNLVGQIIPKSMMLGDFNLTIPSWKLVMDNEPNYVISPWLVDINWRENLIQLENTFTKAVVYKSIKALHTEICIERFNILLAECLEVFLQDPAIQEFGNYFKSTYSLEPSHWAYCYYRIDASNVFVNFEACQNAIKHLFNKGIEINEIENSVVALLKMCRDKFYSHVIEVMKEEGTLRDEYVLERHQQSLDLCLEITQITSNMWTLASELSPCGFYTVELVKEVCSCSFRCPTCRICVHTYQCTCPEGLCRFGLCKHIHYLSEKLKENSRIFIETMDDSIELPNENMESQILPQINTDGTCDFGNASCSQTLSDLQSQMETLEKLEQKRTEALNEINNLIKAVQNSNNMESINTALREVKSILSSATKMENEKPPSPSVPIITLEDERPNVLNKDETMASMKNNYISMSEILDVQIPEDNQEMVNDSVPTENVLETAIALESIDEGNEEMMVLDGTESVEMSHKDGSQEAVMQWLQSDSEIIDFQKYSK